MNSNGIQFDVFESVEKHIALLKPEFDVFESVEKHIALLKPEFPKQALISIGEYPTKILLKEHLIESIPDITPLFICKSSEEIIQWSPSKIIGDFILGLDTKFDTHYWYNVQSFTAKNDAFVTRLKERVIRKQDDALIVSSSWDGIGSALLPFLISRLKESNIVSAALAILPSRVQSPDVQFNAISSIGLCVSQDLSPIILADRDCLESFVGVKRDGSMMKGEIATNYLVELMLAKGSFVQELSESSRSFGVPMYTILSVTGASLKIYGSLENMLDSALCRPLLKFDLSSSLVLNVLVRMPLQLKDSLSRGRIELSIANWFRGKASLKSVFVSEPVYVDEFSDRLDILLIVGGFAVSDIFASMEKKVKDVKSNAVKKGFIKEDEWESIVKSLVKD
jgi:hypothetical protein